MTQQPHNKPEDEATRILREGIRNLKKRLHEETDPDKQKVLRKHIRERGLDLAARAILEEEFSEEELSRVDVEEND